MAGGEGSRLRPITANVPKPLVPVCGKPIMVHILELLRRHGIEDVVATLHYLADEIQSFFDDGSEFGVRIGYSIEDTPLGTAGSVKQAEGVLKGDTFVIISGDALTDCDLTKAIQFHKERGSLATLVLYRVPNPLEFGVVITDDEGRVTRFLEKPGWSEVFSDTVNTGIYILEPEVFGLMDPGRTYDWSQDIFPEILRQGKPIYGYVMDGYWCDVGNLAQYREAQEHVLSGETTLSPVGEQIRPGVWALPESTIDDSAELVPPIAIGRHCRIKQGARVGPYTVLGDNVTVEEDATIERSVVWDGSYLGMGVRIHSATICNRVTIKKDSVVHEDAVIGDRCLIDVGSTIRPRIKLWPDKIIERGSVVTMSLVWGNKWRGSLFRELGVAGISNLEITPDFACRLGAAFGSTLPSHARVITSRDGTRSSRMVKRALIASLLSVGCDVVDLRSVPLPIARHFMRSGAGAAAVNVRKLPGNRRVTLIELLDSHGAYLSRSHERKVESAFFREDYARADSDELGVLEYGSRAIEGYQADFFKQLPTAPGGRRLRIVCDYGYSGISAMLPAMLAQLGVEAIGINAYNDARLAPRTAEEVDRHVHSLQQIVAGLSSDMGVLFTEEGERLTIIDDRGRLVDGNVLFATLGILIAKTHEAPSVALDVTAPQRLEDLLLNHGAKVSRTRSGVRSLMQVAWDQHVTFAGDHRGGFIFPQMHPGFDAMFSLGKIATMLQATGLSLSDIADEIPDFPVAYEQVRCPWEAKGAVMRRLTEELKSGDRMDLMDGIKFRNNGSWVLVLPDAVEPVFHVYAESDSDQDSRRLVEEYGQKIGDLQAAES